MLGVEWRNHQLNRDDQLTPLEEHFLRHRVEWPDETSLEEYARHLRDVIRDPAGGILASIWDGRSQHLSFFR